MQTRAALGAAPTLLAMRRVIYDGRNYRRYGLD